MHHEDDGSLDGGVIVLISAVRDPVGLQDVAIGGYNVVNFDRVAIFCDEAGL